METRGFKAVLMGFMLFFGFYLFLLVFRAVWFIGLLMLPFLIVAGAVYFVGYGMPNFGDVGRRVHNDAEKKARRLLDWLDFNAPHWTWPAISAIRTFLDWLGLQVAKV